MAFAEKYVTDAAGGSGAGTEGDPWTLAEGLDQAVAGDRVNVKSDGAYSLGADTVTNAGTVFDLIVFRGYDSSIGDLENPGRSASDGSLVTTGFPPITLTGTLIPSAFSFFQNLAFTGALSSTLIGSSTIDNFGFTECEVINTQNDAGATAVQGDNFCVLAQSDFECTGATHGVVLDLDLEPTAFACRIKANANTGLAYLSGAFILDNLFIGDGSSVAIDQIAARSRQLIIKGNTIYNWGTAIQRPNVAPTNFISQIYNNHVTDCAKYIDDLYVGTDSTPVIEMNNRTRDNTTPRTGVGDGILSGEVTTDTGGIETDYTNAGADDLSLISVAPGVDAGLGFGT